MAKLAQPTLTPPVVHPAVHLGDVLEPTIFFAHIAKQTGRKCFYLGLHLSKTLVDMWCSGEKRDVFTAAKEAVDIIKEQRREDLIAPILIYIAGADFDAAVLQRVTELLQKGSE